VSLTGDNRVREADGTLIQRRLDDSRQEKKLVADTSGATEREQAELYQVPMTSAIDVSDWALAEASAFMAVEWPRYDAHLGIRWDPLDVVLVAKEANRFARDWFVMEKRLGR
jgi:hypothetical protein